MERVAPTLLTSIRKSKDPLALIALDCDSKFGFQDGSCLFIVKHMLANIFNQSNPRRLKCAKSRILVSDFIATEK